ncbi:MAG: hypothetical protein E2P02_09630 [Acidobacteria bacterium]|nr:MAG: hypothetical protein E2P02_09630 [Acidobacteriota bacterium]
MDLGLARIDLKNFLVDRDRTDHEALVSELVRNDPKLLDGFVLVPCQDERVGKAQTDLRVFLVLLQKRNEPFQSAFVVPLLKA